MNETAQNNETTQPNWSYIDFKTNMLEGENRLPVSIEKMPTTIETGVFGEETQRLVTDTENDPRHRERALTVKMDTGKTKLLLQNKPTIGTEQNVRTATPIRTIGFESAPQYNQSEKVIGTLHTHPADHLASPTDLSELVVDLDDDGLMFEFIGTPGSSYLLIRTMETPGMPVQDKERWVAKMNAELEKRVRQQIKPHYTSGFNAGIQALENTKLVAEIVEEHRLAVYTAKKGSTKYTRASL